MKRVMFMNLAILGLSLLAAGCQDVAQNTSQKGRVLYFGGYDCARIVSHNTAWIYKGELPPPKAKE